MNKQELENQFDDYFSTVWWIDFQKEESVNRKGIGEIKAFIFNTVIPEVLKKGIDIAWDATSEFYNCEICDTEGKLFFENEVKQKAKELYDIDL